jgi:GH43 family beta-xylosidase
LNLNTIAQRKLPSAMKTSPFVQPGRAVAMRRLTWLLAFLVLAAPVLGRAALAVPVDAANPKAANPEAVNAKAAGVPPAAPETFTNPLFQDWGADPWIAQRDGFYYFTATSGDKIEIARARTLTGLAQAPRVTVWKPPAAGPNSRDIWAPELHFLRGKWYLYYAATSEDFSDANRRVFVLESATDDAQGAYIDRGRIVIEGGDYYAIDATVMERPDGSLYLLWSGRPNPGGEKEGGGQCIYIAPMKDPLTVSGPRVQISSPDYEWEIKGWKVNEGPEVLERNGKVFVIYSASGATTTDYCLGLLTNTSSDLLNPLAWSKSPVPVFVGHAGADGKVFAPGHNGSFKSPDSTEDWIVFHAKAKREYGWAGGDWLTRNALPGTRTATRTSAIPFHRACH